MADLAPAELVSPRRRSLALEVGIVVVLAAMLLVPGIGSYSLVDPWETHYGEVARTMLQDHDYVHTKWNGTASGNPADNEGFRSKPVLMFWLMAAGMQAVGVGDDGGYSGEMVDSSRVMFGVRIPFIACAIAGLALMWWMLARLVSRRVAWLAFLVVATTPMFCLIARQAIPDMPMVACTMGAIALFALAVEDGDRPVVMIRRGLDPRHVVLGIAGAFVLVQTMLFARSFLQAPQLALRGPMPSPVWWVPLMIAIWFGALSRDGWLIARLPSVLVGGVICLIHDERIPPRAPGQSAWRYAFDNVLGTWDKHALDRYVLSALPVIAIGGALFASYRQALPAPTLLALLACCVAVSAVWGYVLYTDGWAGVWRVVDRLMAMRRITTMRQVYLLGCYFLLGVSILAKGPPGFAVVVGVAGLHVAVFWRWRALYEGAFEIKRGLLVLAAVAVPWHLGMYLKEGARFVNEYLFTHIISRAASGVDNSPGTFEYYTDQLGHGMWLWAALIPAALAGVFARVSTTTREGRVRVLVGLWAITAVFVFCFVQTKFHHYLLPAIPALGVVVAFYLDDLFSRRERMHWVYGVVAIGIVLLVCRDLMFEPDRWIEMFVYRYDRPWPSAEPWQIDPSDGLLALGGCAVVGIVALCISRWGVLVVGAAGIAISVWALQAYMPQAGKHWGMRDAFATYYSQRSIYGHKRVFFGAGQCVDELRGTGNTWRFETFVPDTLQLGQPMTLTFALHEAARDRIVEQTVFAHGSVSAIGDHDVTVELYAGERAKIAALYRSCQQQPQHRGRRSIAVVDADRLIGWQLYWRGENFWSGGELWSWLPEMKTQLNATNNVEFLKYLNDRARAPLGRRYFLITEASRATSVRTLLPTARARETFQVIDTQSNKFSLASFYL